MECIPAGILETAKDLFDDVQLKHRDHFQVLNHPEMGDVTCEHLGFRLSKTPAEVRRPPCLGEHTAYICMEVLGIPEEVFIELLNDGVFE